MGRLDVNIEDLLERVGSRGPESRNPTAVDHKGTGFIAALKGAMDAFEVDETDGYQSGPRETRLDGGGRGDIRADRRANRPGGSVKWTDNKANAKKE